MQAHNNMTQYQNSIQANVIVNEETDTKQKTTRKSRNFIKKNTYNVKKGRVKWKTLTTRKEALWGYYLW